MPPLFLRKKELGEFLGMSVAQAMSILSEHGVKPVDLGRGRGHGLRWRTSAVIHVADTLHGEAQAKVSVPHRRRVSRPLQGRSAADIFVELSGGNPVQ